jgi:hypothetical protein
MLLSAPGELRFVNWTMMVPTSSPECPNAEAAIMRYRSSALVLIRPFHLERVFFGYLLDQADALIIGKAIV